MKKIVVLLAIVLAVVLSVGALAEGFDLSSMTNEELLALMGSIMDEIQTRTGDTSANDRIGRGSYVVGTDIKAGTYDFTCLESDMYNFEGGGARNVIRVLDESGDYISRAQDVEIGAHAIVSLSDGQVLEIEGCTGALTASTPSWAP